MTADVHFGGIHFGPIHFGSIHLAGSIGVVHSIFGMRRLRVAAVAACNSDAVATAAGFSPAVWTDTAAPHVFSGIAKGWIGGRNRGRLPFLEVAVVSDAGNPVVTEQGGDLTQTLVVRCHCAGGLMAADSQSILILSACLDEIRSSPTQLPELGPCAMGELRQGPWGHQRDATLTVYQTYYR